MTDFKREDYLYLRYVEDYEDEHHKKGDIVRYRKDWLVPELRSRRFNTCFENSELIWDKNPEALENDIAFHKLYKSITIDENLVGYVYLWPEDYLYLDEWLYSHIRKRDKALIENIKKDIVENKKNDNNMVILRDGCPHLNAEIEMHFKKGETLDFTKPGVAALFYDPKWLSLFAKTETIEGEEKEKIFKEDYSNAIKVHKVEDFAPHSTPAEHHYFKIKEEFLVKDEEKLEKLLGLFLLSSEFNIIKNEEGYITYIATVTNDSYDNSDRCVEQKLLTIADRIPKLEALKVHKQACLAYAKRKEKEMADCIAEYNQRAKELEALYQKNKNNLEIFPGTNGQFIHVTETTNIKQKYTLQEIQKFYQNLRELDPDILKHVCFYGGTLPYILTCAKGSREFGDIDIFVPAPYMEDLRKELTKQTSFEMLCDSKPYATQCMLTTRISKDSKELALIKQQAPLGEVSSFFEAALNFMTPREDKKDYVDANGLVHNPLNVYREESLPYYRKIQDFGFKAKLFGINISVFPLYEYDNDIMAKSFNITDINKYLLGVRVLNNTKLEDFIKEVKVYDTTFNILPMEYTLISKQSAISEGSDYRLEKDKEDIEYILAHKEELGIDDEMLHKISENYPDYSISVAYKIEGNTTVTMDGETYKEVVLTKRQIS